MKDYKRLTYKKVNGTTEIYLRIDKDYISSANDIIDEEKYEFVDMILSRLAELEDKIENGTLVELPKKCYHIQWGLGLEINEYDIIEVQYDYHRGKITSVRAFRRNPTTNYIAGTRTFYFNELGETVFFTKAKAEAKLRELKGEQQ